MGEMGWMEKLLNRVSWWVIAVRHLHRPAEVADCPKCQYDGWMSISKQYPEDSPEAITARAQAEKAKEV